MSENSFTRFENQYIFILAVRAKQDLQKDLEDQQGYKDPNITEYIKSLESICDKTKRVMKEIDELNKNVVEPT